MKNRGKFTPMQISGVCLIIEQQGRIQLKPDYFLQKLQDWFESYSDGKWVDFAKCRVNTGRVCFQGGYPIQLVGESMSKHQGILANTQKIKINMKNIKYIHI